VKTSNLVNIEEPRYDAAVKKLLPLVECCTPLAGSSLTDGEAAELERLFRTLADRHRLKILNMLAEAGGKPVCVCEFVPALGLAQPTVSYHLKQLADVGLLERERRGTFAFYRLVPGALERLSDLLAGPADVAGAA
jgi:ArsR family transcriptional regulator